MNNNLLLAAIDWLSGRRNVDTVVAMATHARNHGGLRVSVELEKPHEGLLALVPLADVVGSCDALAGIMYLSFVGIYHKPSMTFYTWLALSFYVIIIRG